MSNAHKRMTTWLLTGAAVLLALPCAYFLYRVAERCVAAGWMAYKFHGYSEEGYVALSQSTAYLAIGVVLVLLAAAVVISRRARREQARLAYRVSRFAAMGYVIGVVMYLALVASPWGVWR